ncbi:hypothetical protein [Aeoliella sp. SH292]|uniref:hypothetical protein n=1 Tax=Aeoliella sp. SH292 TaxID=3454464 RepID=UPI003F9E2B44
MKWFTTTFAIALFASTPVLAHGPQIQITNTDDKIVTRDLFGDGSYTSPTPARSVYVMPVLEDLGIWYTRPNTAERPVIGGPQYYSGPGLAYGSQVGTTDAFAAGGVFTLSLTDGLLAWNGIAFDDPGTEQVRAFRGSPTSMSATATTSDSGPFESLAFAAIATGYNSEAHATARYQFLGDGVDATTEPDDGVYLLSLKLSTSEENIADSDEFYFVMHKNAPHADIRAAIESLGVSPASVQVVGQLIPEPSALVIAAAAIGGVALWRKRKA